MLLTGAITNYIDVPQVVLYLFWIFFVGLLFYLQRESRREGYPLHTDLNGTEKKMLPFYWPPPKTFLLANGETKTLPDGIADSRPVKAVPTAPWRGAPLQPTGNPLVDAVGPASYAERADRPDVTSKGTPRIVPLRADHEYHVDERDPDPVGMPVCGADGVVAGTVRDVWVDRAESIARYLEVELPGEIPRRVLLPFTAARVDMKNQVVKVYSILGHQFSDVPVTRNPDQVTLLEEDRICGYYGGGHLYATAKRSETVV